MKACPGCSVWIPDDAAFCPSCGKPTGSAGASVPPPPPPPPSAPAPGPAQPPPAEPEPTTPAFDRARAETRVRVLGALYMAAGAWTFLSQAYALGMLLTGRAIAEAEAMRSQPPFQGNPDFERMLDYYLELLAEPGIAAIPYFLGLAIGAFYFWSGLQLRDLRGRTMAFVAAIMMVVLFLCSGQCCGCCFTVPLGVAALFILTRADTEAVSRAG